MKMLKSVFTITSLSPTPFICPLSAPKPILPALVLLPQTCFITAAPSLSLNRSCCPLYVPNFILHVLPPRLPTRSPSPITTAAIVFSLPYCCWPQPLPPAPSMSPTLFFPSYYCCPSVSPTALPYNCCHSVSPTALPHNCCPDSIPPPSPPPPHCCPQSVLLSSSGRILQLGEALSKASQLKSPI